MIKLFYPDRQLKLIKTNIFDSIKKTLNKSDFIQGNYVKDFEKLLGENLELFKKMYEISENGNFEGFNILIEKSQYRLNDKELIVLKRAY